MMYLVRVGWRTINLEFLIEAADSALGAPPSEVSPGGLRVSIYPGSRFEVGDEDAARLRLHIEDNLKPTPPTSREGAARVRGQKDRPKTAGAKVIDPSPSDPSRE